jgi:hypothetical protein
MKRTLGLLRASWRGVNRIAQTARETAQRRLLALAAEADPTPSPRHDAWKVVCDEDAKTDSEPASDDGGAPFDDPRLPDNGGLFDHEPLAGGYVLPELEFDSDVRTDVRSDSDEDSSEGERYDTRGKVGAEKASGRENFVDAPGGVGAAVSRSPSPGSGEVTPKEAQLSTSFEQSQTLDPGARGSGDTTDDHRTIRMPGAWHKTCEDVTGSRSQQQDPHGLEQRRLEEGLAGEATRPELRESGYAILKTGGATGQANRPAGHDQAIRPQRTPVMKLSTPRSRRRLLG